MKKEFAILLLIILFIYLTKKRMEKFEFPIKVNYKISSPYNEVSKLRGGKPHNGVDLAIPSNTEIYASEDGKILKSYMNDLGGKQLIVKFNNGFYMGFAHLNKNDFFKIGEGFKKGEVLALSGNTGHSTGSHLHLTMRNEKGIPVDPMKYLIV